MELRDGDLLLRPIAPRDEDALVEGLNDPAIEGFMPLIPAPYTHDHARRWIDRCNEVWADGRSYPFAISSAETGDFLGSIEVTGEGVVGYWIAARARGRGLATTAVRLVCAWTQTRPLRLTTHPANAASQRVAEKAGFRRVGSTVHDPPFRDGTTEAVLFRLD